MQDCYIGDIGDYGKYGLLRQMCRESLSVAVNWYRVIPQKVGKQDDGKFTSYLLAPQDYRSYDSVLYDSLCKVVLQDMDRRILRIEQENLVQAIYYSAAIDADRKIWHDCALDQTKGADVIFLDPDNGLETYKMHQIGRATEKHVRWEELRDYYNRGQNVVLYQHRPQMTTKEKCIEGVMQFQREYLKADCVKLLEFPKYTNRFYFMFIHQSAKQAFEKICTSMVQKWGQNGFCREIAVD